MKILHTLFFCVITTVALSQQAKPKPAVKKLAVNTTYKLGLMPQTGRGKPQYTKITDTITLPITETKALAQCLQSVKKNGVNDVSKCFIPRHVLLVYKNDTLTEKLLICFECEGFRLIGCGDCPADDSKEPNYEKRVAQMTFFNKLFAKYYPKK
jgi:hypothetical protein